MAIYLAQSMAALIVILVILYFVFCRSKEQFEDKKTDFQTLVDAEFANYYRPVESGYLYILKMLSKDPEFMKPVEQYLPKCPPAKGEEIELSSPQVDIQSKRPGGWFYESGNAYVPKPADDEGTDLQQKQSADDPCPQNPNLEMLLAEKLWAFVAKKHNEGLFIGNMVPFYENSTKYGTTNAFQILPKLQFDYIYTLLYMIYAGQLYVSKLSNTSNFIKVDEVNKTIAEYKNIKEGFAPSCCNEPSPEDIAAFNSRANSFSKYRDLFVRTLKLWKDIEKQLKELRDKFEKKINKGFTAENVKDFGLESVINIDDSS
jgi:hypothetical protein